MDLAGRHGRAYLIRRWCSAITFQFSHATSNSGTEQNHSGDVPPLPPEFQSSSPQSHSFEERIEMTASHDPLRDLDLQEAIDLRWTLRDVRAKRWKLSPLKHGHVEKLLDRGLVEMKGEDPVLTEAGRNAIE
jgi:hypothetical protein